MNQEIHSTSRGQARSKDSGQARSTNSGQAKACQNCKERFTIEPEDFSFYKRLSAPSPSYCPRCRMQRRLSHRNERTLYRRKCDLCEEEKVSIYPPETTFPVYCSSCWWSDEWDAKSFAIEYDLQRPFLEQFKKLQGAVPRIGLLNLNSVNSEYTNNSADNKNCYLIFAAENNEDCMYGRLVQGCKSSVDTTFLYDSELCYECVDCRQCYNTLFSDKCQSSTGLLFCSDVRDSNNCILCTNLRHKSYCILNKQYTKEEYEKKKNEILSSRDSIEDAKKQLEKLKSTSVSKFSFQTKCVNATGDYLFNCHDTKESFDASNTKACAYVADAEEPIDFYDGNNVYYRPELCLDIMGTLQSSRSKYSTFIFYCSDVEYCDNIHNCANCFGCIGLRKNKYCILNKEYSPEEYSRLKQKIIASMKRDGSYGSFISPEVSPFGYNETLANDYFPLSKEEAIKSGFRWQDIPTGMFGKETIPAGEIPNTISEIDDGFLKQILACVDCGKNFRITPAELSFYRRMNLPLPEKDFECRHKDRMKKRNPRKLWHRSCQCAGEKSDPPSRTGIKNKELGIKEFATDIRTNQQPTTYNLQQGTEDIDNKESKTRGTYTNTSKNHPDHASGEHCPNEFQTSYAPDRPEIVYCESCYQAEIV